MPAGDGVLTAGGLPLGFGGGAPRKSEDSELNKPPVVLRGLRLRLVEYPPLLADVLPGGLPRFRELR